jgi:hypothetical protein
VLVPLLILAGLALLPYALPAARPAELGRWFPPGNRLAQVLTAITAVAILALTVIAWLGA